MKQTVSSPKATPSAADPDRESARAPQRSGWKRPSTVIYFSLFACAGIVSAATAGTGCVNSVVVGTTDVGGQGGASVSVSVAGPGPSVTTGNGGSGGGGPGALVLNADELPANAMPCGGNACDVPSDMVFIEIASNGNTCTDPHGQTDSNIHSWQFQRQIGLPAQYQAVGTYSLSDPLIYWEQTEALYAPQGGAGVATGSGAPGAGAGTIEVVSIDDTSIHVRFQGTNQNAPEDGDYVATRCTPVVAAPTAVAMTPDQLPSGANPCPNDQCPAGMVFVEIVSDGNTCQNPLGPMNTNDNHWQKGFGIPLQDQAVGTYSLSDMAFFDTGSEFMFQQSSSAAISSTGAMGAGDGTMQIVSIDSTQIEFKLQGNGLNFNDDGDYVAPRCVP